MMSDVIRKRQERFHLEDQPSGSFWLLGGWVAGGGDSVHMHVHFPLQQRHSSFPGTLNCSLLLM